MKKFLIIAIIGLMVIVALFENTGEDVPEETEAVTKTEEISDKDDNKSRSEMTDEDKVEAKRKYEEEKAKEEQEAKEKAEAERKQEEKKAKEEEAKQKAEEEQKAKQKAEEEAEAQAKAEEAEKLRKENEAKEKAEQENAEEIYLQIMRESVGTYVDIQFDKTEKTYVMTPTDQGLIDEISMLPLGIGHEDWGVLVDGMASMSKSGTDLVGEGYTINLVNPLNHENVILWIIDGEVIYNVIDDL